MEVVPGLRDLAAGIFGFSGHNLIATDIEPSELLSHLQDDDPGASASPVFLTWLAQRLHADVYTSDVVLAGLRRESGEGRTLVPRDDLAEHPRVALANRYRDAVRVYSDAAGRGLLTLERGRLGLLSVSLEVEAGARSAGVGRQLARAARSLAPADEPLLAEISPGNAASLRAFLAAGFTPICSEA